MRMSVGFGMASRSVDGRRREPLRNRSLRFRSRFYRRIGQPARTNPGLKSKSWRNDPESRSGSDKAPDDVAYFVLVSRHSLLRQAGSAQTAPARAAKAFSKTAAPAGSACFRDQRADGGPFGDLQSRLADGRQFRLPTGGECGRAFQVRPGPGRRAETGRKRPPWPPSGPRRSRPGRVERRLAIRSAAAAKRSTFVGSASPAVPFQRRQSQDPFINLDRSRVTRIHFGWPGDSRLPAGNRCRTAPQAKFRARSRRPVSAI